MLVKPFASLLLLAAACGTTYAQDFSITGIRVGSSYDEAVALLQSRGFSIAKKYTFPSPDFVGTTFFNSKLSPLNQNLPTGWDRYAIEGFHGHVVLIDHSIRFSPRALPNADQTLQDLRSKYGAKLSNEDMYPALMFQMLWYYGSGNSLQQARQTKCGVNVGGYTGGNVDVADPMQVLRTTCDSEVEAVLDHDKANPHLVDELHVTVTDIKTMRGFAQQVAGQRQQQFNQQTEGAKQNRAPL